jgi:hypothetical protein
VRLLDHFASYFKFPFTHLDEEKFPYSHSSLAWIFLLLEWLASNWPKFAELPDIVEGVVISKNFKAKHTEDIVNFAAYFKNYIEV